MRLKNCVVKEYMTYNTGLYLSYVKKKTIIYYNVVGLGRF